MSSGIEQTYWPAAAPLKEVSLDSSISRVAIEILQRNITPENEFRNKNQDKVHDRIGAKVGLVSEERARRSEKEGAKQSNEKSSFTVEFKGATVLGICETVRG